MAAWKPTHPRSADSTSSKLTARILPRFGNLPLTQLDAQAVAAWQRDMTNEALSPRTIATYLSLLGTICNAAVDTGYLDRSPLPRGRRRRRPAALTATAAEPSPPRMIWLTHPQVQQLADAIDPRYRTLVILAAHTGARWSELTTLRWSDIHTAFPLDDGAISGPGRLRIRPSTPVDQEEQPARRGRSRPRPGGRTIALDQHASDALNAHRDLVASRARDLVFTSPGGSRGPGGQLASANFARVWHPPTSPASGTEPSPPPDSTKSDPSSSARASTTCVTPTPSGCSSSRPPSAPSPSA